MWWIVLIAFWGSIYRLWAIDEVKISLVFIFLWLIGFFGFPMLNLNSYVFLAYEAIMAAILVIIERYKSMT
jgi:hypothetical protein